MRKSFIISMEVLAAISAVIGLYFGWRYFLKPVVFPTPKAAPTEIPEEKLKAVSAGRAVNYWVNRQTNNIYYINDTGEVYKITQEGQDEKVISLNLKNIHFADPSPDQTKVLIAFGYPYQTVFTIFFFNVNFFFFFFLCVFSLPPLFFF